MLSNEMIYILDHYAAKVGWVKDMGMDGLPGEFCHEGKFENIFDALDFFTYDPDQVCLSSRVGKLTFLFSSAGRRSFNRHLTTRCGQRLVSLKPQQKIRWQELIEKSSKFSELFEPVYAPLT